jgi:uncharacterized protein (UPF0212 family)
MTRDSVNAALRAAATTCSRLIQDELGHRNCELEYLACPAAAGCLARACLTERGAIVKMWLSIRRELSPDA